MEAPTTALQLLETAAHAGVTDLWMTTGSDLTSFQEAIARLRQQGRRHPRLLTAPHEHVGLTAALGQQMVQGGPVMTAVHADLGVLHHGGAIHNALVGQVPVLMVSGYPPVTRDRRVAPVYWYQQRFDQGATVRQYVRWDHKLSSLDDVPAVAARALQVATSPPPGPVYLAVPDELARRATDTSPSDPARAVASAPSLQLGAGASGLVGEVATRLLGARRPVVVLERSGRDTATVPVVTRLAGDWGIEVVSGRFRVNVEDGFAGLRTARVLAEADVVVVVESPVPWVPVHHEPAPDAWIASIGTDPLNRDLPLGGLPCDAVGQADPAAFLRALEDELAQRAGAADRERARGRAAAWSPPSREPVPTRLDPRAVGVALDEVLEPTDLLVSEVFDTSPIRRPRAGTLFEKGASSLGWAQAAAVGACYAAGGTPTFAVTGDGSFLFGAPTSVLWLQQALRSPVVTVILDNGGYRTGTTTLAQHYPHGAAMADHDLSGGTLEPGVDHAAMARAAGAFGATVERLDELVPTLREARRACAEGGVPAIVVVRVPSHRSRVTTG